MYKLPVTKTELNNYAEGLLYLLEARDSNAPKRYLYHEGWDMPQAGLGLAGNGLDVLGMYDLQSARLLFTCEIDNALAQDDGWLLLTIQKQ